VQGATGRIPGFVDTGLNLVHVDDVAAGQLSALRNGKVGERYILGGQNVPFAQMVKDISRLVARRPPRLRIPRAIAMPIAYAAESVAYVTGREPFATLDGVRGEALHVLQLAKGGARTWLPGSPLHGGPRRRDPLVSGCRLPALSSRAPTSFSASCPTSSGYTLRRQLDSGAIIAETRKSKPCTQHATPPAQRGTSDPRIERGTYERR
jgi:hypothetical protein